MQLHISFSVLLASVLVVLSGLDAAEARPLKRDVGMITVPLKRLNSAREGLHPQLLLQQHINRSHKRLARMTGRTEPTSHELRANMNKRMFLLGGPSLNKIRPTKRFNRGGLTKSRVPLTQPAAFHAGSDDDEAESTAQGQAASPFAHSGTKGHGQGQGQGVGASSTASAAAAAGTGPGISAVDVADAANGGLTIADPPTASDSIGLDIEANDVGYIGTVQMGTPPQDFKLLMDSGSADLWVGSENCQTEGQAGGCGNHTFLGSQSSSTFVDTNAPFAVTYGSGSVSGDIITDNLVVAGLALNNHTFGVATTESVDFSSDLVPFDGLMGLAQSTLSEQGVPTPVESLASAGLISEAVTSFKLGRVSDGDNDGEVTFGGLDSSKFNAASLVTFNNVNTEGFWEGSVDSFSVDGQDLGLSGRTAILDTGTTLIIAPDADAQAVHAAIPGSASDGQGGFTIPCTTSAVLSLSFGGQNFDIDTGDLLFAPVNADDLTGDCVSGISSGQIGGAKEWLVGDVFLKNVYFSTDVGSNQISLATLT